MCVLQNGKRDLDGCNLEAIAVWSLAVGMSRRQLVELMADLKIRWKLAELREIFKRRAEIGKINPIVRN